MKFTISKEQLLSGLQSVSNVVGSRSSLPVLANVLLTATEGRLELTGTDLDVTVRCAVEANVIKPGSLTLPAKKLSDLTREFLNNELEFELEKNTVSVQSGASYYKLNMLPAEEFPPMASFSEKKKIVAPQAKLRSMLAKTSFAVSTDETRYVLNGIFVSFKDHRITMVATDGRRLALVEEEADIPTESHGELIIPTKAINELTRLLGETGDVEIKITENQVAFLIHKDKELNTLLVTKVVDGKYPNYKQVIPSESGERITLERESLLGALRRAEIVTSEKSNSVKLAFGGNTLTITANTPDVGEAREVLAINYKGKEIAIAFNPSFLMDPLKVLDVDEVFFEVTDELSPGVVKMNGPFLYVIMPMRMS